VRFTITPLGSAGGRTVGQVVDDIVRYLEPRVSAGKGQAPSIPGGDGPSSYYADRGTEPGRWLGFGAGETGLRGAVAPGHFARVLAGRDPRTGARLITAQGSAGRRPTLGAGTETRRAADGTPLYSVRDVAAALRVSQREVEAMMAAGQRAAIAALAGASTGSPSHVSEPAGSYIVPVVDGAGSAWATEREVDRVEDARSRGIAPEEVSGSGAPDDLLPLAHAARLSGVTAQYLRSLCRRYERDRQAIDAALGESRQPRRAYVVAYRGTKGQWLIRRKDLVSFLERRVAPAVRVGYDLTLTTEKSLGVLALLGDDRARAAVLSAIEAGNDCGLRHLEHSAASARRKGQEVGVRGWTVASFRHLTSRALDPFPHHHNVVANTVVDEYGNRRALDARGLYRHAQEASALATAEMRYRLTEALCVRWRPGRSGGWEIDGVSDEVVREFSRRRTEIEDAVAELEAAIGRRTSLDELQGVVTSTRPAKEEVDSTSLIAGWWARAHAHGLSPKLLAGCTDREPTPQAVDQTSVFAALADPERGLCANSSIFTKADVIGALADLPVPTASGLVQPLLLPAAEIERLADTFLSSRDVVPLRPHGVPATSALAQQPVFSTREILGVQRRILAHYDAGVNASAAIVSKEECEAALGAAPHLTPEQQALVRSFCTSGHRVQCAVGRAGAGKTTTMRAAVAAWTSAGHRVVGTAVKGEAARHLATGARISTETVAWYLARADRPTLPLDDRTVLLVDEASTISDRDLDAILAMAERSGTTVRLIGDPDQHGAVAAGGMFRHLCDRSPDDVPELTITQRMTDPAERTAVDLLLSGNVDEALDALAASGRLHVAEDDVSLYIGMLRRWWESHLAGDHHPMVDRRHHTRGQLNRLARQLLRTNGELGAEEITASGERAFAVGDRVVARMAARHLHVPDQPDAYVRNGAVGRVTAVSAGHVRAADTVEVVFDGIGTIAIPRSFFDEHAGPGGRRDVGIDHAYAVTSYAVQGATYGTSTSRIDEGASRAEAYVDITRGRAANHLFLTRSRDPLDGEHLPKVPPPSIPDNVARRLRDSGPERTAIEVDPSACREPSSPGAILAAADRFAAPDPDGAARLARYAPPADLVEALPERSEVPFLAKRWDDTVAAIVRYRSRWDTSPGAGPFGWALGPCVEGSEPERDEVAQQIVQLTVATAAEGLRPHGWDSLPAWAAQHVSEAAAEGSCRVDPASISALYGRVREYRNSHGLADDDASASLNVVVTVLGPPPPNTGDRAAYRLLSEELVRSSAPARTPERSIA
jgi:conjugative relaxase-like TrwC/TraI family protein